MHEIINPYLLYIGLALGGVGLCAALPRRRLNPQVIGAVLLSLGLGLVLLALGLKNPGALPNLHFYVFGFVALGGALRVITHPRPVYAALYFILTILASCGLYLILSAEFMAFALVIVYAGAILITYLFVIMLATQAPSEERVEVLAVYDVEARAPVAATIAGFLLLDALTGLMFRGLPSLSPPGHAPSESLLAELPRKVELARVESVLRTLGELREGERVSGVDVPSRSVALSGHDTDRTVPLPDQFAVRNVEAIGFDLLNGHPGSIEIAGVILLMAMLGATVLSRRQVELEEEAKRRQARALAGAGAVFADKEARP